MLYKQDDIFHQSPIKIYASLLFVYHNLLFIDSGL